MRSMSLLPAMLLGMGVELAPRELPMASGGPSGFFKVPKYGSHKCECGRTISANKNQCLACKEASK